MRNGDGPNEPLEFKVLVYKSVGLVGFAWFHGETKLGTADELENILNRFAGEGWDIAQLIGVANNSGIILRRRAR